MSVRDPSITLRQIRDAGERARLICRDKSLKVLLGDWQATAALERYLEIMGEAVKRLPEELRESNSDIPWREIAAMRNHLSHGYDSVDYQVLWDTVDKDVPALLKRVEQMLNDLK
jgi:uncharacterized protein with HEPN domain